MDSNRTFLVIDDEQDILDAIVRLFRRDYRVLTATTASEAWEIVENEDVQVVMTDQRMPRLSGVDFLTRLRHMRPEIVRILLTGYSNVEHVIDAINEGHVYRYISKPWNPTELKLLLAQAFEYYETQRERERLVTELKAANERLEAQNQLLSSANEELKTMDRVKTVFMEVVSHELNTPIAVILGYTYLLQKELDSDDRVLVKKALSGTDTCANRLKNITNRIFKMLSSQDPAATLNLEWLDIPEHIAVLEEQLQPFLERRNQRLVVSVASETPKIMADPEKVRDILLNLLMNAIKFSPDGHAITLDIAQGTSGLIEFSVQDEGIGIAESDQAQIFDAFFSSFDSQHHSSGDFEFGKRGIGLGLSVAQRFAVMHEGHIEFDSQEGHGSTFTLFLPVRPSTETLKHIERDAIYLPAH